MTVGDAAPAAAPRRRRRAPSRQHDVLVIGAGPAGSSCAYWLADAGWDVVVVEKKRFPREKTCGDGLTPRAVRQLEDMGLGDTLAGSHRYSGLQAYGWGRSLVLPWPEHPVFPAYGYTITRHDLDGIVAERAAKAGATVLQGTEVVAPIVDDGAPRGAGGGPSGRGTGGDDEDVAGRLDEPGAWHGARPGAVLPRVLGAQVRDHGSGDEREIRAHYVVVADGANSRVGRALGTARARDYPLGMALRGYYRSPRHDDPLIESHLDLRDADGNAVPGYGWIFPLGDGRVNVGVGLLSVDRRWKGINTSRLMEAFVAQAPASWGLSAETCLGAPTGGKLPMSMAVGPHAGPNTVLAGDAGGSINPFNGEGIAYGYETGRLAAAFVADALGGEGSAALKRYDQYLADTYGDYYRLGRAFVRLVSNPTAMRWCVSIGMRSAPFMAELLRIMANLMRPDAPGAAEIGYDALLRLAEHLPAPLAAALTE